MNVYITPEIIAKELSVTAKTVRDWLRNGELIGLKVGSSWRVHQNDFDRYLEGQRLSLLMERAQRKHTNIEWLEGQCTHCGVYIPVPKNEKNVVCSQECKKMYDRVTADIHQIGTLDYSNYSGRVVPLF
ncbi:MAG: helix-turn-helix domain-containing protein [Reichenbachiella sp.]